MLGLLKLADKKAQLGRFQRQGLLPGVHLVAFAPYSIQLLSQSFHFFNDDGPSGRSSGRQGGIAALRVCAAW